MQRLTKYPLLLKQLAKAVLPSDPQGALVKQAVQAVESLVALINTIISNAEGLEDISVALEESQSGIFSFLLWEQLFCPFPSLSHFDLS